jgi:hypothetical protein
MLQKYRPNTTHIAYKRPTNWSVLCSHYFGTAAHLSLGQIVTQLLAIHYCHFRSSLLCFNCAQLSVRSYSFTFAVTEIAEALAS